MGEKLKRNLFLENQKEFSSLLGACLKDTCQFYFPLESEIDKSLLGRLPQTKRSSSPASQISDILLPLQIPGCLPERLFSIILMVSCQKIFQTDISKTTLEPSDLYASVWSPGNFEKCLLF